VIAPTCSDNLRGRVMTGSLVGTGLMDVLAKVVVCPDCGLALRLAREAGGSSRP